MRTAGLILFFLLTTPVIWAALTSSSQVVPTVFVTAKKINRYTATHGAKSIITHDEMIATGASTLSQALQEMGGVQLQNTVGNDSQVALSLRGFGVNASSNTLLLINGIPISYPDLMPIDLNIIPTQEIELVEVVSGSESVLYGDQAVAGVVNVVTRKNAQENFSLSCNAGSYDQRTCYAAVSNHYRQLQFGFNVMTAHTNNYRANNDSDQSRLSGALNYAYATGALGIDYQIASERMGYPGGLTAEQVAQDRRQAANSIDFFRDVNGYIQLSHEQKVNSNWRLETDLVHRSMSGNGILTVPFQQSRTTNYIRPQLKGAIGKALLTGGVDYGQDHYHLHSNFGLTNDQQQKYGLFGVMNYPWTQRLNVSVGLRGAQLNNTLDTPNADHTLNRAMASTLGGQYELSPSAQLYVRRASNFRFPKADEDAATNDHLPLKVQRGVSYEAGMNWAWKKLSNKIGLYQLNLRDEITFDPTQTPEQPFGSNRNLSPTVRRGFSLSELYQVNDRVNVSGQYSFVNARFQSGANAGNRIPLVAELIGHLGVNIKLLSYWNLYTEAAYTGNQYPANDDTNSFGKLGGYTVYNFNLRYAFKNLSTSIRINNLFNKYYYFYSVLQPGMGEFFYPAPARNFMVTVKYVFS